MADAICRWRNGTPKTVVELVNSIPHIKMPIDVFRSFMENRWDGDFFRTPYQLACQLGLYCEAEDGYYYPRFDHDIDEKEAEDYLLFWLPRYYVPNPYTRKDGFQDIDCPTYFLKELYEYVRKNPNCTYKDAYEYCFHETAKNNDDIIRNYINSYSRILSFSRDGLLNITNVNPNIVFKNMDRNDKKAFFDNFDNENAFVRETQESLQQIYYGAPGTGKSNKIKEEVDDLGKIHFRTTFHPDSDYSTFVGCYKPKSHKKNMLNGNDINETQLLSSFFDSNSPKYNRMNKARYLYEALVHTKDIRDLGLDAQMVADKLNAKGFTGCAYTTEATCMYNIYDWLKEDGYIVENKITYEFTPQAFLKAYTEAWLHQATGEPVYLVIEEINRGNCAQIFGDIFQLLDRDEQGFSRYEISPDSDIQDYIGGLGLIISGIVNSEGKDVSAEIASGEILKLPDNLHIWATMNTSDQSLFPIDSAFKRRWDWQYMPIANGNKGWRISANGNEYDWWEFLEKINALIGEKTSSEDKKLGYYFCKAKDGVIDAKMFVGKVIFYLWNDVFKDYEFEGDAFNDIEGKLTFDKFYKTIEGTTSVVEEKVVLFLKNLGVVPVFESEDEDIEDDNNDDLDSSSTSRDQSKYSINGEGSYKKGPLAREVIRKYLTSHEEMSVDDALRLFNTWGLTVPHFVESQQQFDLRTAASSDVNKRAVMVTWGDNNILYVTTQWNLSTITEFVNAVNRQDWGIRIERL